MSTSGRMTLTAPSDREILIARTFDAPRRLVFDALTKPELVRRWLYGSEEWRIVECEIDLKVGGRIRYGWRHTSGQYMGLRGAFREIAPPERIVHTELFDEDWTGGETAVTTVLTEQGGKTTITMTVLYSSREARDGALATPMEQGMAQSYDRLDEFLCSKIGQGA